MVHKRIGSDTDWENQVGYSRAVQKGGQVYVSGTTATDETGDIVGKNDPYTQTLQALRNIEAALEETDAALTDVVRTRLFVTDIEQWEPIGNAHADLFGEIRPATSMVEVASLIAPEMLVEVEATAVVDHTETE